MTDALPTLNVLDRLGGADNLWAAGLGANGSGQPVPCRQSSALHSPQHSELQLGLLGPNLCKSTQPQR
eukprot:1147880-Rhodomonas_salina.3